MTRFSSCLGKYLFQASWAHQERPFMCRHYFVDAWSSSSATCWVHDTVSWKSKGTSLEWPPPGELGIINPHDPLIRPYSCPGVGEKKLKATLRKFMVQLFPPIPTRHGSCRFKAIHPRKFNSSPLKKGPKPKRKQSSSNPPCFRGKLAVKLQECSLDLLYPPRTPVAKSRFTWMIIPVSKWLIAMVSKSPKWGCSPSKWLKWLINGGDPNHLLTGMILQVVDSQG